MYTPYHYLTAFIEHHKSSHQILTSYSKISDATMKRDFCMMLKVQAGQILDSRGTDFQIVKCIEI